VLFQDLTPIGALEEQIDAKCGIKRGFQLEQSEKIPDPFVCTNLQYVAAFIGPYTHQAKAVVPSAIGVDATAFEPLWLVKNTRYATGMLVAFEDVVADQ
jgi:hypothetical protein